MLDFLSASMALVADSALLQLYALQDLASSLSGNCSEWQMQFQAHSMSGKCNVWRVQMTIATW